MGWLLESKDRAFHVKMAVAGHMGGVDPKSKIPSVGGRDFFVSSIPSHSFVFQMLPRVDTEDTKAKRKSPCLQCWHKQASDGYMVWREQGERVGREHACGNRKREGGGWG